MDDMAAGKSNLSDNHDTEVVKKSKSIFKNLLAKRRESSIEKDIAPTINDTLRTVQDLNFQLNKKLETVTASLHVAESTIVENQNKITTLESEINKLVLLLSANEIKSNELDDKYKSDMVNMNQLLSAEKVHVDELFSQIQELQELLQHQQTEHVVEVQDLFNKYKDSERRIDNMTINFNHLKEDYDIKNEEVQQLYCNIEQLQVELQNVHDKNDQDCELLIEKFTTAREVFINQYEDERNLWFNEKNMIVQDYESRIYVWNNELITSNNKIIELTSALELAQKELIDMRERPLLLSRGSIYLNILESERSKYELDRQEWLHVMNKLNKEKTQLEIDKSTMNTAVLQANKQVTTKTNEINQLLSTIQELKDELSQLHSTIEESHVLTSEFGSWENSPMNKTVDKSGYDLYDNENRNHNKTHVDKPLWMDRPATPPITIGIHESLSIIPAPTSPLKQSILQRIK